MNFKTVQVDVVFVLYLTHKTEVPTHTEICHSQYFFYYKQWFSIYCNEFGKCNPYYNEFCKCSPVVKMLLQCCYLLMQELYHAELYQQRLMNLVQSWKLSPNLGLKIDRLIKFDDKILQNK
jgi:hypothetical protein